MKPSVGMIGLGIMGSAMSANLMRAKYRVIGYDVLPARLRQHRRAGGDTAPSARELAQRARVIVTSLPSSQALLDTANELAGLPGPARIVIETSTLPIAIKEQARDMMRASRTTLLDCPLSGTGAQARAKDLVVYASGDRAAYRRVVPVLKGFSRSHHYLGAFGAGSTLKFVANLLVAIHNVAAAEALVLAMKAGLDPAAAFNAIADGAGSSRMLQVRGPSMVNNDYSNANMKLDVWQKDMAIIGDFARQLGSPTPLFTATGPLYTAAVNMGHGNEDTGAVCKVLEDMGGIRRKVHKYKVQSGK
jgi:3-hydroxyisobutyrate dehydrogenase-like beta-hydroxyacid dehydrogenase